MDEYRRADGPSSSRCLAAALFAIFGNHLWPWRYHFFGGVGKDPDATVLISTLILVYTFFVAAYGALFPSLIGKGIGSMRSIRKTGRVTWRATALCSMIVGAGLDLYRVVNSTGDLYFTTMRHLSAAKVHDAAVEFTRYLVVNVLIFLLALAVMFWPEQPEDATSGSAGTQAPLNRHPAAPGASDSTPGQNRAAGTEIESSGNTPAA